MNAVRRSERGFGLVETLVAVAIAGSALAMFLSGMSSGTIVTSQADRLSTAHELARSQIESTKAAAYNPPPYTYTSISAPSGYAVTSMAGAIAGANSDIEQVTVTVTKNSVTVYSLQDYKVNR